MATQQHHHARQTAQQAAQAAAHAAQVAHQQAQQINREFDTLRQMETKLRLLIGGKVRNKTRILEACGRMDNLRKRLAKKTKGWDTTAEIRNWRDSRCSS